MTPKHFEIKTTYERAGEKGLNTKVNEVFLMTDYTFKAVETTTVCAAATARRTSSCVFGVDCSIAFSSFVPQRDYP